MSAGIVQDAANRQDGLPPAKRPRTSPDVGPSPTPSGQPQTDCQPGGVRKDLTLDFLNSIIDITSTTPSPAGTVPSPASASTVEVASIEGDKADQNVPATRPFVKIKMKRTGTNGLSGISRPNAFLKDENGPKKVSPSAHPSPIPTKLEKGQPNRIDDSFEETTSATSQQQPADSPAPSALSRPTTAETPAAEPATMASPQSIAMKRKWASGEMDGVAKKAALTRQLNAGHSKPSLADYYLARANKTVEKIPPPKSLSRGSLDLNTPPVPDMPFVRSLSGRPYDMAPNGDGRLIHGFGALFPDGYAPRLALDGKTFHWMCPIQDCSHERLYLKSHGKHFLKEHRTCLLNDNGDGTFAVTGYNGKQESPVVVSRIHKSHRARSPVADIQSSPPPGVNAGKPLQSEQGTDVSEAFLCAPSGRGYLTYPDGSRSFGVLIPDGYDRIASAENPWVCPIRYCLQPWGSQHGLSIHFARIHGGKILNDNLDGTFCEMGHRSDDPKYRAIRGWGKNDALVVTQGPLPDSTERLPTASQAKVNGVPSATPVASAATSTTYSSQPKTHYLAPASATRKVKKLEGGALDTWNYIRPHLTQFMECPDASWVPELLKLPKLRDIAWDSVYLAENGFTDKVVRDVATMVMQVTGEVPHKVCSRCRDGHKGPYGECIVMSSQAPIEARLVFNACASCIYHGQGTYCTLKFWGKKRAEEDAAIMAARAPPAPIPQGLEQEESPEAAGSQVREVCEDRSEVRHSQRLQVKETMAQNVPEPRPSRNDASPDPPYMPYEDTLSMEPPPSSQRQLRTSNRRSEQQPQQPLLINSTTDTMQIEDWELAPGRLRSTAPREDDSQPAENIAYSKAYLTANQSVRVSEDASFRVEVVSSGASLRWTAYPDRMRICSVGAGKVKVRIQGEEEFDLGPHGMFRLLPGRSCVVLNKLYGDAVLHVSEFSDYS